MSEELAEGSLMALTPGQVSELERLGVDNVRERLRYADPGGGSIVPGLGDGKMLRSDVEGWLGEQDKAARKRAEKLQEDTLWWAKAAAWFSGVGIIVEQSSLSLHVKMEARWPQSRRSRVGMRNEPRRRKGSRERGSGDPSFQSTPWLKVIPCEGRQ
jgi:hypothetical protein